MNTQTQFTPRFGEHEWRLAYGVALKILKAPDQAEDAAQEALLRAYRARESYSGTARFDSWLYRIAYTTALGFLRKPHYRRYQSARPGSSWDREFDTFESSLQGPEDQANAAQLADRLKGCLGGMRELDRVAFTERFLLGTSERELGEKLGVSTNAAKQRAFRARRTVRQCMQAKQQSQQETCVYCS